MEGMSNSVLRGFVRVFHCFVEALHCLSKTLRRLVSVAKISRSVANFHAYIEKTSAANQNKCILVNTVKLKE